MGLKLSNFWVSIAGRTASDTHCKVLKISKFQGSFSFIVHCLQNIQTLYSTRPIWTNDKPSGSQRSFSISLTYTACWIPIYIKDLPI